MVKDNHSVVEPKRTNETLVNSYVYNWELVSFSNDKIRKVVFSVVSWVRDLKRKTAWK
jgi:hypothetical protein